jgi:hypothetical protein
MGLDMFGKRDVIVFAALLSRERCGGNAHVPLKQHSTKSLW